MVSMDVEVFKMVIEMCNENDSYEDRMLLYETLLKEKRELQDKDLPLEERSYSFTGLGLRKV
jgi:hypothetical protein